MSLNRSWMYKRRENGFLLPSFVEGVETFINFATSQPRWMDGDKIKCPCTARKCQNKGYLTPNIVRVHLAQNGFVSNYYTWIFQGESMSRTDENHDVEFGVTYNVRDESPNAYTRMVHDVAGPEFNMDVDDEDEPPNPEAQKFYDMLQVADQELWFGCQNHSQLSLVARLMSIKSENGLSDRCFDQITELMKEIVPEPNVVIRNFYDSKKLMRGMGLPAEKIDCCKKGCMIYWGEDSEMINCKFCSSPRFKRNHYENTKNVSYKKMFYFPLTPRLQRLYASNTTANDMRWHAEHEIKDGVMHHPSDSPAWKHFNDIHSGFKAESRNIRLGLSADGFQPFGQSGKQYSSWHVVLTPYNLPPSMCMKEQYMFLTVLVPGPHNPKDKLDVYLQPLIAELNQLWSVGAPTYDISKKQNFQMKTALMWTISDFRVRNAFGVEHSRKVSVSGQHNSPLSQAYTNATPASSHGEIVPDSSSSAAIRGGRGHTRCYPVGNKLTTDRIIDPVSTSISDIFKKSIWPTRFNWKDVPDHHKDMYFEEFRKEYMWDPNEESNIKKIFLRHAGNRYSSMVSSWKNKLKPNCLKVEEWEAFKAYWLTENVQRKSMINKANRLSEVAGPGMGPSKHVGGSRPAIGHAKQLRKEHNGEDADVFETFLRMHMRANGTFADERSRIINEEVKARIAAAEDAGEDVDRNKIYIEVVGGPKKQRLFGTGSTASSFISTGRCTESSSQQESESLREEVKRLEQQLQDRDATIDELQVQMTEERIAREAMRTEMREEMQTAMASMFQEAMRKGSFPTPPS